MAFDPNLKCNVDGYAGEMVLIDVAQSCGTVADPRTLPFVPIGGSTDTTISIDGETIDVTDANSVGGWRTFINSFKTAEISGSGIAKATDGAKSNLVALYKYKAQSQDPSCFRCCSVVAVNTVTDVVGPSYTAEGRPVFELNFEMMYQS